MRTLNIGLGLLVLTCAAGGVALAQDAGSRPAAEAPAAAAHDGFGGVRPGPGFRGDRMDGHRGGPQRMRGARGAEAGKHIEGRIAFLKAELKITDAQSRQWDQFAAFMPDAAKTGADAQAAVKSALRERGASDAPPVRKPLLDRMGAQEKRLQTMLQLAQKRKAATENLYKVLSDEQKKLAEDLM